nr:PD40 domain-containing protein [Acidobacteriota bacterium]
MTSIRRLLVAAALVFALPFFGSVPTMEQAQPQAPATAPAPAAKKSVELDDIIAWKNIGTTTLSNDGQWFAWRVAPQEGDAELVVRNIASGKETKFTLGEASAPGGGAAPPPPAFAVVAASGPSFSDDSKWIAFNTNPPRTEAQRLRRQRRPVQGGVTLVNLATGEKKEYARI